MPVERVWLDYDYDDYDDDYELTGEVMSGSLHGGEIHVTRWRWDLSAVHQSPDFIMMIIFYGHNMMIIVMMMVMMLIMIMRIMMSEHEEEEEHNGLRFSWQWG